MFKLLRKLARFGPRVVINYRLINSWSVMRELYKERGKL